MNRINRLFAILLAIQNNKRIRGQDLAEKFEVSKRTIYRDIQALNESGVPFIYLCEKNRKTPMSSRFASMKKSCVGYGSGIKKLNRRGL